MKIVGVAGLPRSGKDSLAELFIKAGYFGISFGDVVRRFSRERHADAADPISVANMTETSNWLREQKGADVILQEALQQFKDQEASGLHYEGLVLWSVRAPVEVDFILERGGELVWVEATDAVRHARGLQHLREGELQISLDEFKRQEALQWKPQPGIPTEVQMNISYVKEKATRTLVNNGDSMGEFLHKAQELMKSMGVKY
jgi:dephospho-CoA kinase